MSIIPNYNEGVGDCYYLKDNREKAEYRHKLMREYYELRGYVVNTFRINANGLDMICEKENEVLGVEIINWKEDCYLSFKRFRKMKLNWDNYGAMLKSNGDTRKYRRIIVYSFSSNIESMLPYLERANVELHEIGYQDIPPKEINGWID